MTGPAVLPLAAVLLAAALYVRGWRALAARPHGARGIGPAHAASSLIGLAAVAVALYSPLADASHRLFSAHMVQHLLLMAVAPPLLVAGRPGRVTWAAAGPAARRRLRQLAGAPAIRQAARLERNGVAVVTLSVLALWAWHAPGLYQAALRSELIHAAEHTCLFASGLLLWRFVAGAAAGRRHGRALLAVFVSGLAAAALGALLTLSTTVLYPAYTHGAPSGVGSRGLTPLEDQQLAGSVMWVPPGLLSLTTMMVLAHGWLREAERRSVRRDALRSGAGRAGGAR